MGYLRIKNWWKQLGFESSYLHRCGSHAKVGYFVTTVCEEWNLVQFGATDVISPNISRLWDYRSDDTDVAWKLIDDPLKLRIQRTARTEIVESDRPYSGTLLIIQTTIFYPFSRHLSALSTPEHYYWTVKALWSKLELPLCCAASTLRAPECQSLPVAWLAS